MIFDMAVLSSFSGAGVPEGETVGTGVREPWELVCTELFCAIAGWSSVSLPWHADRDKISAGSIRSMGNRGNMGDV
jgi:hypothetical protein